MTTCGKPPVVFTTDSHEVPLPAGHRFPMAKYRMLRERVEAELGHRVSLQPAPAATMAELCQAHDSAYVNRVFQGQLSRTEVRALGLPWSTALRDRVLHSAGATVAAARSALANGASASLAGGTHHAHRHGPSGFCVFNDVATAALAALEQTTVSRVAVLDLDVHQGDGTATILDGVPTAFTASVHCRTNFPFKKVRSSFDIELQDQCSSEAYLAACQEALGVALDYGRPDLLFYLAGADPYENDTLGRMKVSGPALLKRDTLVMATLKARRIPIVVVMAGGYAEQISETVTLQLNTMSVFSDVFAPIEPAQFE